MEALSSRPTAADYAQNTADHALDIARENAGLKQKMTPYGIRVGENVTDSSGRTHKLQAIDGGYQWQRISTEEEEQSWRDRMAAHVKALNEAAAVERTAEAAAEAARPPYEELSREEWTGDSSKKHVVCQTCGKEFDLWFNGGELDGRKCCGVTYRLEHARIDFVTSRGGN